MGLFDIFSRSPAQKAEKLKTKLSQKYGDPSTRQAAIEALGALYVPEATEALLSRFTFSVEPQTRDAEEKETVFHLLGQRGETAAEAIQAFLKHHEVGSSWALRTLQSILPEAQTLGFVCEFLQKLSRTYSRSSEKKLVLLQYLADKQHPTIPSATLPFLDDMTDDVKINALLVLAKHPTEEARIPILELLLAPSTAKRVQIHALEALYTSGLPVQGYREKVESLLSPPWYLNRAGVLRRLDESTPKEPSQKEATPKNEDK
ncbi:MAG: HEAT repeat domain-containing protein [Proteobacteria bacterium]|nr:HEAT repeat domain-containing protein [Cystobacterineae bacterium]MCL2258695.1 HEAT repeat domain-containing protein [Cystobacterineae bacterium]MCL2313895.1 HEAT repeat domain-containing protein [Pseudomonadota bacterium]